jgi:hypothetical protein
MFYLQNGPNVPWSYQGRGVGTLGYCYYTLKTVVRVWASLVGRLAKDKVGVFVDEHMRPKYPNAGTQNHRSLMNGCAWIIA